MKMKIGSDTQRKRKSQNRSRKKLIYSMKTTYLGKKAQLLIHDMHQEQIPIPTEFPCIQVETPSRNIIPAFAFSPQSSSLQSFLPSPLPTIPLQLSSPPSRNTLFQIFSPTRNTDLSSSIAIPHLHYSFSPIIEQNDIADEFQIPEFSEDAIPPLPVLPTLPTLPEIPTVHTVENTDMTTIRKDVFVSPSNVLQSSVSSKKEKE